MRTKAIKDFLTKATHPDLAELYNFNMEVQVNVAQDGGTPVEGTYQGRQWRGWTDGFQTWKPIRIPYSAMKEPNYEDKPMRFDLERYAEGVGMTGWDWVNKRTRWVAFDFDSITGHSVKHQQKLSAEELERIKNLASELPWTTIRKSAGGSGLHIYVFVDADVEIPTHTEHAAVARSILCLMSGLLGYSFQSSVDVCGGNMWVWHRKMKGTDGLTLIKKGGTLNRLPDNWQDHIGVAMRRSRKVQPNFTDDLFDQMSGQRLKQELDSEHRKLLNFLQENNCRWWWDNDYNMLVTHTIHLKEAYDQLKLKGLFQTLSTGAERGHDHNCYAFPLTMGAWVVRRYGQRTAEAPTWSQDANGYTRCYFNKDCDFETLCRIYQGIEHEKGGYQFNSLKDAQSVIRLMGGSIDTPESLTYNKTRLIVHNDNKVLVKVDNASNQVAPGWIDEKKTLSKIIDTSRPQKEEQSTLVEDLVRHVVTASGDDGGWLINTSNTWRVEPINHVYAALSSLGYNNRDSKNLVGTSIRNPWTLVNIPFQPEYPGNRQWNRNAAQLAVLPNLDRDSRSYPTWTSMLKHLGEDLDQAVKEDQWCNSNGILTGADYLKTWIASLFKAPMDPLPYLFFYGDQNCGKSSFHESVGKLISRGYRRAEHAITSSSGFNSELANAVLCAIEEIDLSRNALALNRIKDWVTSRQITIHAKGETPYLSQNSTHWVQCGNDMRHCPVFPGDSRITVVKVKSLVSEIPRYMFESRIMAEASDFLGDILDLELPKPNGRLNIPVLNNQSKTFLMETNKTALELFIEEHVRSVDGCAVTISDFFDRFVNWLEPVEATRWSKRRVTSESGFIRGRLTQNANWHYGNITFDQDAVPSQPYIVDGVFLRKVK